MTSGEVCRPSRTSWHCSATFKCRSWNGGLCIAPSSSYPFADTCSACEADHRAVCPGHAEKEVKTNPKHEASSSLLDGRSQHGGMDSKNFAPDGNLLKPFTMLQTSNSCLDMSNSQWNTSISSHQPHCYEFHNPHQLPCIPERIICMFCYLQDNLTSSSTVYWSPKEENALCFN